MQVQEDTTKDNVDDWIENEPVGLNWEVTTEALVVNNADAWSIEGLQEGMIYDVRFMRTIGAAGEQNRDTTDSLVNVRGLAILSDITVNAQSGELATYTCKFTGTGDLEQETE